MQVFEFHFNPKLKEDQIFDSFCYEPENIYEKRLGNLYIVSFLKNILPQNSRFLNNLTSTIKKKYYTKPQYPPEKSLKESLREANRFLENLTKTGDVSWLGNLSFAALSLKGFELNFTKVGDLKIYLLRGGEITDIDKNLKFQEFEPYPLKIFSNIVSGKLARDDIILVLTKEVSELFKNQNLLNEIATLVPLNEKKLKELLKTKKEELLRVSGICFLIALSQEDLARQRETVSYKKTIRRFSLFQIFKPIKKIIQKIVPSPLKSVNLTINRWRPQISLPKIRIPALIFLAPKQIKQSFFNFLKNKNTILIFSLIFFLLLGFFIFQQKEEWQLKNYQITLNQIQNKVEQAETFLILKDENPAAAKEANSLLKEAWQEVSRLARMNSTFPSTFQSQIFSLQTLIEKNLSQLNKLEKIEEPQLFFEFKPEEFIPQKIIVAGKDLYFFNSYSQNLFKVSPEGKGFLIDGVQKFNLATLVEDKILFFQKPDLLFPFENGEFTNSLTLSPPYPDFKFSDFSVYKLNLYFLDAEKGEIIKYPYLKDLEWGNPQAWLSETKKALGAKSMAIDGSVWFLNKDNSIDRYHTGDFQETLKLDLFPVPKDFAKIITSLTLPYLYILEPAQRRILILNKEGDSGKIIQQFQSEKFDGLLDFAISQDGKTIYLLNNLKVYQINL